MPRTNKFVDVWKQIDMKGGDTEKCWPWLGAFSSTGRPTFKVAGRSLTPYIIAKELHIGEEEAKAVKAATEGRFVWRHNCDKGMHPIGCCNPFHIIPGNHSQNMDDMKQRGQHGLPHNTVKAIKRGLKAGATHQELADKFYVSRETVTAINNERTYAHVKDDEE